MRFVLPVAAALLFAPFALGAPAPVVARSPLEACRDLGSRSFQAGSACEVTRRGAYLIGSARTLQEGIEAQAKRLKDVGGVFFPRACSRRGDLHRELQAATQFLVLLESGSSPRSLTQPALPNPGDFCNDADALKRLRDQYELVNDRLVAARDAAAGLDATVNHACSVAAVLCQRVPSTAMDAPSPSALAGALRRSGQPGGEAAALLLERTVGAGSALPVEEWLSSGYEASGIVLQEVSREATTDLRRDLALLALQKAANGRSRSAMRVSVTEAFADADFDDAFRESMRAALVAGCGSRDPAALQATCLDLNSEEINRLVDDGKRALTDAGSQVLRDVVADARRLDQKRVLDAYRTTMGQVSDQLRSIEEGRAKLAEKVSEATTAIGKAGDAVTEASDKVEDLTRQIADAPANARTALQAELNRANDLLTAQRRAFEEQVRQQAEVLQKGLAEAIGKQLGIDKALLDEFRAIPGVARDIQDKVTSFTREWSPANVADTFKAKFSQQLSDLGMQNAGGLASIGVTMAVAAIAERKAARRHKETMAQLRQINARLAQIEQRLGAIENTLKDIQATLRVMNTKLDQIQVTLDVRFASQERMLRDTQIAIRFLQDAQIQSCARAVSLSSPAGGPRSCGAHLSAEFAQQDVRDCSGQISRYPPSFQAAIAGDPDEGLGASDEQRAAALTRVGLLQLTHRRLGGCWVDSRRVTAQRASVSGALQRYTCLDPGGEPREVQAFSTPLPDGLAQLVRFTTAVSANQDLQLRAPFVSEEYVRAEEWDARFGMLDAALRKSEMLLGRLVPLADWTFGVPQGVAAVDLVPRLARLEAVMANPEEQRAASANVQAARMTERITLRDDASQALAAASEVFAPGPIHDRSPEGVIAPEAALNIGRALVTKAYGAPTPGSVQRYELDSSTIKCASCIRARLGPGWLVVSPNNDLTCRSWATFLGADVASFWCARPSPRLGLVLPEVLRDQNAGADWRRKVCERVSDFSGALPLERARTPRERALAELAKHHAERIGTCAALSSAAPRGSPAPAGQFIVPLPTVAAYRTDAFAVSPAFLDVDAIRDRVVEDRVVLSAVRAAIRSEGTPFAQLGAELIARSAGQERTQAACNSPYSNERLARLIEVAWPNNFANQNQGD